MKKTIALLLVLVMALSLAACGEKDPGADKPETSDSAAAAEPTAEETEVGTAQVWRNAMNRPDKWQISEAGQTYDMDGMIWVCLLAPAPAAERGDTVTISGERYTLRNSVRDSADVRVYWQLQKNQ